MSESIRFATIVKRWVIGLVAACLLAFAGYALLAKSGEEPSRAGQAPGGGARTFPVAVATAKTGDPKFTVIASPSDSTRAGVGRCRERTCTSISSAEGGDEPDTQRTPSATSPRAAKLSRGPTTTRFAATSTDKT